MGRTCNETLFLAHRYYRCVASCVAACKRLPCECPAADKSCWCKCQVQHGVLTGARAHRAQSEGTGPLTAGSHDGTTNWHLLCLLPAEDPCKVFCLPAHLLPPPACLPQLPGLKVERDVRERSYFQEDEEW